MSSAEDWGDEATVQRANPALPETVEAPPVAPEEPAVSVLAPAGSNTMIWLGVAAFALFVAGVVVVAAVAAWLYVLRTDPSAVPSPADPAVAAVATSPLSVEAPDAAVQWIRLQTDSGERVAEGKTALSGSVPPGAYLLSVKLVGKPVLQGQLEVPGAGGRLVCSPEKDGSLSCAGLSAPVLLRR
jgi:hypothetical protein